LILPPHLSIGERTAIKEDRIMDILVDFVESISWTDIITSFLRIIVVLLLSWLAMKLLGLFLIHLERDLLFKSQKDGEPEIFGVDMLGESWVIIKGRLKTKPIRQWDVGREFLRRIKLAFDENSVEIPFPQRSLFFRDANAPDQAAFMAAMEQQAASTDAAFSKAQMREVDRKHAATPPSEP
jgi:hypothetical protein